jgi:hypothetical protein
MEHKIIVNEEFQLEFVPLLPSHFFERGSIAKQPMKITAAHENRSNAQSPRVKSKDGEGALVLCVACGGKE